jgi:hypothetical protein
MRWTVGALVGATVLVLAAGCNAAAPTATPPPAPGAPQPGAPTTPPVNVNVAEALKTAEKEFGLLAKGDWAGAWALWTDRAKKEVAQAVFVEANTACPAALKRQYQLQAVTPVSDTLIELTFRRGDQVEHGALRSSNSAWAFEPGGGMLVEYANGAKAAIDRRKSENAC